MRAALCLVLAGASLFLALWLSLHPFPLENHRLKMLVKGAKSPLCVLWMISERVQTVRCV
jgi:hypothetical protein